MLEHPSDTAIRCWAVASRALTPAARVTTYPVGRLVRACAAAAVLGSLVLGVTAFAQGQAGDGPAPYPKKEADWPGRGAIRVFDYMNQNRSWFWTQRSKKQGAVVFAGDSLTGGWQQLETAFPGLNVANRGIGGDTSRGLLFRFQQDVLDLKPRAVVILTGSNDLSALQPPKDTIYNIESMLDLCARQGDIPVVLVTVPPRADPQAPVQPERIAELNAAIKHLAQSNSKVRVLDLHSLLADDTGAPIKQYFQADRLHLNSAGYDVWKTALQKTFTDMHVTGAR